MGQHLAQTGSAISVAWIALGSNLDQPERYVADAFDTLDQTPGVRLLGCSQLYRTAPVGGPADQADFCNAAAAVATTLSPFQLLDALNAIEADRGRVRTERFGPRTLDLDIIAFDARHMASDRLTLPHPRAAERGFVLVPLVEIAPALSLGGPGRVIDCRHGVDASDITPWG